MVLFPSLPPELNVNIWSLLDWKEKLNLRSVCKSWTALINDDMIFWQEKLLHDTILKQADGVRIFQIIHINQICITTKDLHTAEEYRLYVLAKKMAPKLTECQRHLQTLWRKLEGYEFNLNLNNKTIVADIIRSNKIMSPMRRTLGLIEHAFGKKVCILCNWNNCNQKKNSKLLSIAPVTLKKNNKKKRVRFSL